MVAVSQVGREADAALDTVVRLPVRASTAREMARLRRESLAGSLAISGVHLTPAALDALVDRGIVLAETRLDDVLAARDLAAAAAWVTEQRPRLADDRRAVLTVDDVRELHRRIAAGGEDPGGLWRQRTLPAHERIVSPPPWLIPFEVSALTERMRRAPSDARAPWIAAFLARFARIAPFRYGNGRVARLAVELALRRLGLPPLAWPAADAAAYRRALVAAESGEPAALVAGVARALRDAGWRLEAAALGEPLLPLRDLAGARYETLARAARRGRLRAVERDGRITTTAAWIDRYTAERWRRP